MKNNIIKHSNGNFDKKSAIEGMQLGPYTPDDMIGLMMVSSIKADMINEVTSNGHEIPTDPESVEALTKLIDSYGSDIHKKAVNIARFKTENGEDGESKEENAKFIEAARARASLNREKLGERNLEIPEDIKHDDVPGLMEQEIFRPELKDIMNTKEEDDE